MDAFQDDIFRLLTVKEDLHPDLVPYVEDTSFGVCLKHPLVFEMFYNEQRNAYVNHIYKKKLEYVNKHISDKKYLKVFIMYERPYRLEKLIELSHELSDKEYWETLAWIWTDSENLWQYRSMLGLLLNVDRPGRETMMDGEEKEFLAKLPDEFMVYRGHHGVNRLGYSWSLSYGKALWFAERYNQAKHGVIKAKANKKDVIAVFLGRNEYEVVIDPRKLKSIKTFTSIKRPLWLQKIYDEAKDVFKLSKKGSMHGPTHWEKVEQNGLALAKKNHADKMVVQLFALLHDCKRENENDDPLHGHRAAEFVELLFKQSKLPISIEQKSLLIGACKWHNDGWVSGNLTIGTCWDADRLDLTRVGITPDPELLSTQAGKEMLWKV